jgi:hypothetical protein
MAAEYGRFWLMGPTVAHPLNVTPHKLIGAMRALSVVPLQAGSAAVVEVDEPEPGNGELLVDGIATAVAAGVTG